MNHQTSDFSQFSVFGVLSCKESVLCGELCVVKDCWNCPLHGFPDCDKKLISELTKHVKASLY